MSQINERAGWMYYHFWGPEHPYSPESIAAKERSRILDAADGPSQLSSNGEAGKMAIGNGSEARQVAGDIEIYRRTLGGAQKGPAALSALAIGDQVESRVKLESVSGSIPALARGKVTEANDASVKIDLGRFGVHELSRDAAARAFMVLPSYGRTDVIRESIANATPHQAVNRGDRVKDSRGAQYHVEKLDTFGRRLYVIDESGTEHCIESSTLELVDPQTAFTTVEGMQTEPFPPGSKVQVVNVDPVYNMYRTRGVPNMEASAYIGQIGLLEFAFYPTGTGVRMYRVLFDRGAVRDFSDTEIQPVAVPGL